MLILTFLPNCVTFIHPFLILLHRGRFLNCVPKAQNELGSTGFVEKAPFCNFGRNPSLQCTTDIPIKPINRPINRYRPINRIGKSQKSQYRIGIGSADYKGLYRLIGFTNYSYFCRHKKSLNWVKLVQSLV